MHVFMFIAVTEKDVHNILRVLSFGVDGI